MSIHEEIKLHALDLSVGQTLPNVRCPACGGGSTRESSFSITRTEQGILYNCYRVKCGYRGFVPSQPSRSVVGEAASSSVRVFRRHTRALSQEEQDWFWNRYGITREEIQHFRYCDSMERVDQPVRDIRGYTIGHNLRSYKGDTPKSILYPESETVPQLDFPGISRKLLTPRDILLVEDQLSAIKCNRIVSTVALMGTHLSPEKAQYLLNCGIRMLVIWFDADAVIKAHKTADKYRLAFDNVLVVSPNQDTPDPKDLPEEEIKKWMNF